MSLADTLILFWPARRKTPVLKSLLLWHQRSRERRALLDLTPEQLADIGLSAEDADNEARRWAWEGANRPPYC